MELEEKKPQHTGSVLKAYTKASFRYPLLLMVVFVMTIGMQIAAIVSPLYLRDFINILSKGTPSSVVTSSLLALLGMYALIGFAQWLFRRLQWFSILQIEAEVMADLSNDAFQNLIKHGHTFFISNFAGSLTRKVTRYSRSYESVLDSIVLNFLPTFLFATGSIWVLCTRNVWLGLVLFIWVVLFVTIQFFMTRWLQPLRAARTKEDSAMTGTLSDAVSNQSAIALFASETYEGANFFTAVGKWRDAALRAWKADSWVQATQSALAVLIEVGLLWVAVLLWNKGLITVGDFLLIQVYILGLIDQIWGIGSTLRRVYDAFSEASEMIEIIETPHEIQDAKDATSLALTKGEIVFDNVSFGFSKEKTILDSFSLAIKGGEKIALVGSSGAGKSTITKLLLRFHDIQKGSISIDGQDITKITQESLRSNIAFVPQEPVLFHRSLKENIRYGKHDATDEEVIEAAKQAHCHEFISGLSEGYDTLVGERGVKLSGGERQRVIIARAILKNAPILVLDEATSSLDSESEALIQDALAKLMQGKTVIAIAHRLSTVMKMDRIIVMEKGKVVIAGTHDELLSQESNLYKKLWDIQAGGFIDEEGE